MKTRYESLLIYALQKAQDSPDPSTQNAALLVCPSSGAILIEEVNRFPDNIHTSEERWERPAKYNYVEHAERNAIYAAAREGIKTSGLIMVCPWLACVECGRAIIQAGITKCIGLKQKATNPRWDESIKIAMDMLKEAGVEVELLDAHAGVVLRRDGKEIEF